MHGPERISDRKEPATGLHRGVQQQKHVLLTGPDKKGPYISTGSGRDMEMQAVWLCESRYITSI